jgi:hypothetical protein
MPLFNCLKVSALQTTQVHAAVMGWVMNATPSARAPIVQVGSWVGPRTRMALGPGTHEIHTPNGQTRSESLYQLSHRGKVGHNSAVYQYIGVCVCVQNITIICGRTGNDNVRIA